MSKSIISKFLILLLVVGLLFAVAPTKQAQAATLDVCSTCTYTTINAALTAAVAGDTITVAAGTYVEDVVVNKAITLQGAGMGTTTIVATTGNTSPLTFNTSGATVSGFHITHNYTQAELDAWNFNNNGVTFYQNTTGNTLANCKVTKSRNGIYINNARGNILNGNTIENNRTGINLTNYVDNTQITNNIIQKNWTIGIVYYQGSAGLPTNFSTVTVTGNTFSNNWYSEILLKDNGSVVSADTGVLNVTNNTFGDSPVTYSTSADPSLNEPNFAGLKPVEFGGTATMPTTPLPTLRIYNVPGVTLQKDGKTLVVGAAPNFTTIQAAIDAAAAGDTILVYPGAYDETASGRTLDSGGTYQFGLFFDSAKPGITVQGVKADGTVITDAADVVASIKTNATNSFGYSGVFVEADNITITGLEFLDNYVGGAVNNNKTIEVIGNNFTYKDNIMSVTGGGSLYLNDWNYNDLTKVSHFESYNISENLFKFGASVDISSGVGVSGLAASRVISNNVFTADGEDVYWANISFNGTIPSVGWFLYPVGGATISGNTFTGGDMPIRSRGIVEDDFDWASYATGNTFDKAVIAWDTVNNKPRAYTYTSGTYTLNNVILIGTVIQDEIGHALPGDEVRVIKGTFDEDVTVDKDITLIGIPDPFAPSPAVVINGLINITADGASVSNLKIAPGNVSGQVAAISINAGNTTVSGNLIDGMAGDSTASVKGIFVYGGSTTALQNISISGNTVKNISNPGAGIKGTDGIQIQGNLIGVNVANNTIQNISSQGWAYGIEVTPSGANPTLPPQDVVITGNTILNVSAVTYPGIALSVDAYNPSNPANASEVTVSLNRFNLMPVVNKDSAHSLNAKKNWWGIPDGPQPSMMYGTMDTSPWCTNAECTLFADAPMVTIAAVSPVVCGNTTTSTIDINVAGIPSLTPLQGYQFRLHFDKTITSIANLVTDIVNGGFVANGGFLVVNWIDESTGEISSTPTSVVGVAYSQFTPSTSIGGGKLASITLTHLGVAGNINLSLSDVVLSTRDGYVIPSEVSATATTLTLEPAVKNITQNLGYCTLAEAVADAAASGDTLQLMADIAIPATVTVNKALTLDLNGKVATYSTTDNSYALLVNGTAAALTVVDGITPSTGKILVVDGDTDTITEGRGISVIAGSLTLTSGTIQAPYAGVYVRPGASMVMNGGTIGGTVDPLYGIVILGTGSSLDINGGAIEATYFAVSGNGTAGYGDTTITIDGGSLTSTTAAAIYHPQDGDLTITAGTISGINGIEMKAGNLVVSGGTILGTGPYADPTANDNGSVETGDAILLNGRDAYTGDITVNITGGTITSSNAYALRDYKAADQALKTSSVAISGGTFTGGSGKEAVTFSPELRAAELAESETANLALTGGLYNTDPDYFVFVPYGTVLDGAMYKIVGISLNVNSFYYWKEGTTFLGVKADIGTTNFLFSEATSVTVETFSGAAGAYALQQTNVLKVPGNFAVNSLTSPFNIFGTYVSSSWQTTRETEYGQHVAPTRVLVTVVLPSGTLTAEAVLSAGGPFTYADIQPSIVIDSFGYMAFSGVRGLSAGVTATNFNFNMATGIELKLYAGTQLLQTNTAPAGSPLFNNLYTGISGPFDIFGTFDYTQDFWPGTSGTPNWTNVRETEYGQTLGPTKVVATVTLPGNVILTAEMSNPSGDRTTILPGVNGLITLQGILAPRAGVPVRLTSGSVVRDTTSTALSDINYGFTGVETLTYTFTTSQPRYLNVTTASGKTFLVNGDKTLQALRLFGGDVNQDDKITVSDASDVGTAWGSTANPEANINYDGIVNIQDLALVGGNYGLISATAYSGWSPLLP